MYLFTVSDLLLEIERHELEERLNAPQRNVSVKILFGIYINRFLQLTLDLFF